LANWYERSSRLDRSSVAQVLVRRSSLSQHGISLTSTNRAGDTAENNTESPFWTLSISPRARLSRCPDCARTTQFSYRCSRVAAISMFRVCTFRQERSCAICRCCTIAQCSFCRGTYWPWLGRSEEIVWSFRLAGGLC